MDRWLRRVHLRAHRRVDAVGADQQRAVGLHGGAVSAFDQRGNGTVRILAVAGHAMAEPDRVGPGALDQLVMQQHVEAATMHGVLRPVVAGQKSARLGVDVVAVEPDQRPFLGGQSDAVEVGLAESEVVQLAHGVGLHVDADAERAHLADGFVHDAGHADLVQCERRREAADAAARNEDWSVVHAHPIRKPRGGHYPWAADRGKARLTLTSPDDVLAKSVAAVQKAAAFIP